MLQTPQPTVLVVDDSKDWRLQIRQILQARPQWKIVAEAGDGAEAVRVRLCPLTCFLVKEKAHASAVA